MNETPVCVGIDVAKATLEVAVRPSGAQWVSANDEAGIQTLLGQLRALAPTLVVLEATGGYEHAVAATLATAGMPVVIANPRQIRAFARATGQLAKTDAIDAQILALFAERVRPTPRPLPDDATQALEALLTRRRQVLEMLVAEKNRLGVARASVRRDISQHIRWLERRVADLDRELHAGVRASPVWRAQDDLLQSVPGVGPVLSYTLLAALPELGTLGRKQIPRWWASRPWRAIAARTAAAARAGAGGPPCARCSTWPRSRRRSGIPSCGTAISGSGRRASLIKSRSSRACADCS